MSETFRNETARSANGDRLLYEKESFCKYADISPATFYKWTRLDGFPVIRCGSKLLVPAREVRDWLAAHIGQNLLPDGVNGGREA